MWLLLLDDQPSLGNADNDGVALGEAGVCNPLAREPDPRAGIHVAREGTARAGLLYPELETRDRWTKWGGAGSEVLLRAVVRGQGHGRSYWVGWIRCLAACMAMRGNAVEVRVQGHWARGVAEVVRMPLGLGEARSEPSPWQAIARIPIFLRPEHREHRGHREYPLSPRRREGVCQWCAHNGWRELIRRPL